MTVTANFKTELLSIIPNLRAFALSLTKTADRADDLVQETLMKATIMRNEFYSQMRKRGREVQDSEGVLASQLATHPEQQGHMDLKDFRDALETLPDDQREALVLIGANGFSYEEAAEIIGVAVGTVKSRVSRARTRLMDDLDVEGESSYGPDSISTQIVGMH